MYAQKAIDGTSMHVLYKCSIYILYVFFILAFVFILTHINIKYRVICRCLHVYISKCPYWMNEWRLLLCLFCCMFEFLVQVYVFMCVYHTQYVYVCVCVWRFFCQFCSSVFFKFISFLFGAQRHKNGKFSGIEFVCYLNQFFMAWKTHTHTYTHTYKQSEIHLKMYAQNDKRTLQHFYGRVVYVKTYIKWPFFL